MNKPKWVLAAKIEGEFQAEVLRGLLEAQGIPAYISMEGAARALGVNIGPFGEVDILVPDDRLQDALAVIEAYQAGEFENMGDEDSEA
ncbi:MAG: DUF2007 domain-containing protein [Anaerolineae bacterium]|nr:DUF2007 domain-containing protein [Anaerolineae bacterium]MBL6966614.1 DUF2007 domain-containing protein [Anaerolineales bacterium]